MEPLSLHQFRDQPVEVAERLRHAGVGAAPAEAHAALLARCASLAAVMGFSPQAIPQALFVPGRLELLGKHTDYAGGRSIVATVERGLCALALPRNDNRLRIIQASGEGEVEFPIHADLVPAAGHWSNYPMTVARRLARNFPGPLRGADVVFAGDLPPAAGMSSSSALVILAFLILARINRLAQRDEFRRNIDSSEALAGYLGTIENGQTFGSLPGDRGVGTFGGSEDHTAILCCRPGYFSQYSFCPVRFERLIPMPCDHVLVIASSGVAAEKTGAALRHYNRISQLTAAILRHFNDASAQAYPSLSAALASSPSAPDEIRRVVANAANESFPPGLLVGRLDQFIEESLRLVPAAGDALFQRDLAALGPLVDRSQNLAERCLLNQTPQTLFLARSARQNGALAASAFGAGFGGSVWALVPLADADEFVTRWESLYRAAFPEPARAACFFLTRPGPPAVDLGTVATGFDLL